MWPFTKDAEIIGNKMKSSIFKSGCVESRREVSSFYFRYFNATVFNNKLPPNTSIYWNKRLLTTAGRCLQAAFDERRVAFIQLSVKICDTIERVRDTLLHEMCHAASWVLDGMQHTDHGPCFQYWAERAMRIHQDLPRIDNFHTYIIRKAFTYACQKCSASIHRHSKSIDLSSHICSKCGGKFVLLENDPPPLPDEGEREQHSNDNDDDNDDDGGDHGIINYYYYNSNSYDSSFREKQQKKKQARKSTKNKSRRRAEEGKCGNSSSSSSSNNSKMMMMMNNNTTTKGKRRRRGSKRSNREDESLADFIRQNKRQVKLKHRDLSNKEILNLLQKQYDKIYRHSS